MLEERNWHFYQVGFSFLYGDLTMPVEERTWDNLSGDIREVEWQGVWEQ